MYMIDAAQNQEDVDNIRKAMKSAKGPGNFRNLFMYSTNGKKEGIQIIPLSEVASKDEFLNIKNVSRDDIMAAHRLSPQVMGIIPKKTGGFGEVEKASRVFVCNKLMLLQKRMEELNSWLGEYIVRPPYSMDYSKETVVALELSAFKSFDTIQTIYIHFFHEISIKSKLIPIVSS